MPKVLAGDDIPYAALARELFDPNSNEQKLIPFLGAGASLAPMTPATPLAVPYPDLKTIEDILDLLKLHPGGHARTIVQLMLLLGCYLDEVEASGTLPPQPDLTRLSAEPFPPSAARLARFFTYESKYTILEQVGASLTRVLANSNAPTITSERELVEALDALVMATGIADPPDPLSSISSFYENLLDRTRLWNDLRQVFSHKITSRPIHALIAQIAKAHLSRPGAVDYLVITTNYDTLIEQALEAAHVPYAALVTERKTHKVVVRFSPDVPNAAALTDRNKDFFPNDFVLLHPSSLVVIYKMHGCLHPALGQTEDGIVISDDDYVNYLARLEATGGMVPSHVKTLMRAKAFLFLGYSLKDWNFRIMFEAVLRTRQIAEEVRDYSVMYSFGRYEERFLEKNRITVILSDLGDFSTRISPYASKLAEVPA
jgi:hypothetical protein